MAEIQREETKEIYFDDYPEEIAETIVSVSSLTILLHLIDINQLFKKHVIKETNKRIVAEENSIIKKGLPLEEFPICFSLQVFIDPNGVRQTSDGIELKGITYFLKFMRYFGRSIKYLVCNFRGASEIQTNIVFSYIHKYCINLQRLYFLGLRCSLVNSLKNSFDNISIVLFSHCRLDNHLCKLNEHFPNLKEIYFLGRNDFTLGLLIIRLLYSILCSSFV